MKKVVYAVLTVAAACGLLYIEGASLMAGRFPAGTSINGKDVSFETAEEAESVFANDLTDYSLTITGRNGVTDTIKGSEIGLTREYYGGASELIPKGSRNYRWLAGVLRPQQYTVSSTVTYDRDKLAERVNALAFFDAANVVAPVNASVKEENGVYTVSRENNGTTLNREKTLQDITAAIENLDTSLDLDASGDYENARVTASDTSLQDEADTMNRYAAFHLELPFGDTTESVDSDTMQSWITLGAGDSVSIDTGAIADYVEGLAKKYNTYGSDRQFTTTAGNTITISGGNYGWILDKEQTAAAIVDALQNQNGGSVDPVWDQTAAQLGSHDWGGTYVEIDLDNQHVYVYQDGQISVSTDCVSGKASAGHGTPDGTYRIAFKQKDAVLRGEGYASPVSYWMPFNMGIGLHDATWRSSFGGTIYVRSGSHGCINLPLKAAGEVYQTIQSGEPVFVYGGMSQSQAQSYKGTIRGTSSVKPEANAEKPSEAIAEEAEKEAEKTHETIPGSDAGAETPADTTAASTSDAEAAAAAAQQAALEQAQAAAAAAQQQAQAQQAAAQAQQQAAQSQQSSQAQQPAQSQQPSQAQQTGQSGQAAGTQDQQNAAAQQAAAEAAAAAAQAAAAQQAAAQAQQPAPQP